MSVFIIVPDDPDAEVDEETQALLTSDFEIGHYIRERIVPRAVLYYTGNQNYCVDYLFDWCFIRPGVLVPTGKNTCMNRRGRFPVIF